MSRTGRPPDQEGPPAPVEVVRGSATGHELDALHHVLLRRDRTERLARWRRLRRAALRDTPESTGDR